MAGPTPGKVILFLGSDRVLASRRALAPTSVDPLSRLVLPAAMFDPRGRKGRQPEGAADGGGGYPTAQLACAQRLLDTARRLHREVTIVDVNQPGDGRDLVGRYVGPEDVLPVLIRADGKRLVGEESFTREGLAGFLAGA